jgi:hypothetical protein
MTLFDGKPIVAVTPDPRELDALRWAATAYCVKMSTLGRKIRWLDDGTPDLSEQEREAAHHWKAFEHIIRHDLQAKPVIVNTGNSHEIRLHIEWKALP